ncbi:hypothetical protein BROUX41_003185 [Berkeleyomyces rouxiae]|uniref:uncharacterized protein n=1 Tax=Berkeleyomyces rouxiae TaxID=2035830 RepID=UPI003B7CA3AB
MCYYVSHIRECHNCNSEYTILISELPCVAARKNGVFGHCDAGAESTQRRTTETCWRCHDNNVHQCRSRPLRPDIDRRLPPMYTRNLNPNY